MTNSVFLIFCFFPNTSCRVEPVCPNSQWPVSQTIYWQIYQQFQIHYDQLAKSNFVDAGWVLQPCDLFGFLVRTLFDKMLPYSQQVITIYSLTYTPEIQMSCMAASAKLALHQQSLTYGDFAKSGVTVEKNYQLHRTQKLQASTRSIDGE